MLYTVYFFAYRNNIFVPVLQIDEILCSETIVIIENNIESNKGIGEIHLPSGRKLIYSLFFAIYPDFQKFPAQVFIF